MSRILLVKPYWPYPYGKGEHTYNRIWPPLSLANCAAILEKQGDNVDILDAHALRIKPKDIKSHVKGFDKIFITSSSLDKWQCPNIDIAPFLETARHIRGLTDELYVMGYHGTVDIEGILNKTQAKAVIRGTPEYIVADICQNKDLSEIEGVSFCSNGKIVSNPDGGNFDLKNLPVPAFHLLDAKRYSYEILGKDFAIFEMGRGCNYGCKFCNKIMYGARLRTKSKEQVCEELRFAIEECGVTTGYFMDLEFLAYKGLVRDVCDFLIVKKYHFTWCCQTRADSLDRETLNKMKKAGCKLIHIGAESGVQKLLDLVGKNTTEQKLVEGIEMCKDAGIKTLAFFLFGFMGETATDREAIFQFAKKLDTNFVSFHKVYPYEHSDVYLPNINSNKEIDTYIRKIYFKYYLRFSYLRKENIGVLFRGIKLFLGRLITLS